MLFLITGKGNETRQKIGKKFMPCLTDTQYALEALEEYNKKNRIIPKKKNVI